MDRVGFGQNCPGYILLQAFLLIQFLQDKGGSAENTVKSDLFVKGFGWVKSRCLTIIQFSQRNHFAEAAIKGVSFFQQAFHYADLGTGQNKMRVLQPAVNDILKNRIHALGFFKSAEIWILVDHNNQMFLQC